MLLYNKKGYDECGKTALVKCDHEIKKDNIRNACENLKSP